jgi:uncharacterized integral membrane protein (TIGR00698 family)
MTSKEKVWRLVFPILALGSLHPLVSSAQALFAGLFAALVFGNPWFQQTKKWAPKLLAYSVVGLGAGMNLNIVFKVGAEGFLYTVVGISASLLVGWTLGKILKTGRESSILISVGTAICGGSAIAAVAPVIRARSEDVSVSLVTVFMLNATALFLFPWLGHHFDLTETQFGVFSALAIHDTSSVVGSAVQFGPKALEVATTVKLTRALWIIPVALAFAMFQRFNSKEQGTNSIKKPWFILGFLAMAALVTYIPQAQVAGAFINWVAKRFLVMTLFLIGSNCPLSSLKQVGVKPLVQGLVLWILVTVSTLSAIKIGWIS